ncbi:Polysulphide reductase, NrfD [Thermosinus carboxydivorans Nor1]|uniref:Polysulphide reductase, NrfD n=1 Tax=Thermosinus carboxydivorans Nor1 TaxID=401526 RepID=A1HNC2_9FIRM|nr:NrfD/PsrC family molybdoenzyme membrane anchor subunit [Thermosinus carboxydivorans]EAX48286.1 Polysulphide reductase, NrfD [Thermosinus carboxydivorans Nor1]
MQFVVQTTWGHLVAWYLFLAGAGAGVYMLGIGSKLWRRDDSLARTAYFWGPALVAFGSLLLVLDLGQPTRAVLAVIRFYSSMISIGTIILALFICLGLYQFYCAWAKKEALPVFDRIGFGLAIGTATYTGLLLGVVKAIPFWNNPLLPALFLLSALSSGAGLVLVLAVIDKGLRGVKETVIVTVMHLDLWLLFSKAFLLTALLVVAGTGNAATVASVDILLKGSLALPFWGLVVFAGLALPLYIELCSKDHSSKNALICGLGLLVGALALRYSIVVAGVWMPLG